MVSAGDAFLEKNGIFPQRFADNDSRWIELVREPGKDCK